MTQPPHNNSISTRRFAKATPEVTFDDDYKQSKLSPTAILRQSENKSINKKRIALFVLGMVERIDFEAVPTVILGRFDRPHPRANELDLTEYNAVNRGVSRIHCQLEYQDGKIVVTDLGSTNGTYVNGKRLDPNQPCVMARGDELIVGRLPVQIVSG